MATCGLAPVPVPSAGCGVQGQPQLLGEKETSPFLPLPKVITTNQPYYKSSVQHSHILSLTPQAKLPEDFCEFVSQVCFTNRAKTALCDHGLSPQQPPSASATPEQHLQGVGSQWCLVSTPSKDFCSLPFACPGKLSCTSDFESTLLFSQHLNCTGETGQQAGPAAHPETDRLGCVPVVPVSPGEQITWMSSDTKRTTENNPRNWGVFRCHSDRHSLRTQSSSLA